MNSDDEPTSAVPFASSRVTYFATDSAALTWHRSPAKHRWTISLKHLRVVGKFETDPLPTWGKATFGADSGLPAQTPTTFRYPVTSPPARMHYARSTLGARAGPLSATPERSLLEPTR